MHDKFHSAIALQRLAPDAPELLIEQDGRLAVYYSPFDHVRTGARIAIVGITPGAQQSRCALTAAHAGLARGLSVEDALTSAKDAASFSGAMRANLVAMLDYVGVARWLGLQTTAALWGESLGLAHFTSVLRYPVFVDGKDYGGASPDMLGHTLLRKQIDAWFAEEMASLPHVLWVPLGEKVARVVRDVGQRRAPAARILEGLPHPSGANAERISYFLGRKSREALSPKTNPARIEDGRRRAMTIMKELLG